jgi:ribose 5-phosphate isomerase RpiB
MIVTARQLDDLHRQNGANGHLVLPYRARLTPLAQDWIKAKRVALGYSDVATPANGGNGNGAGLAIASAAAPGEAATKTDACCTKCAHAEGACCSTAYLWWCDGPNGPAKAALTTHEKESGLKALDAPAGAKQIVPVVKKLAAEVKAGRAAGGVLMVQNAAAAMVYANRCPSLRAVLGTCQEAVEQGVQLVAANVLVIEYPHRTLQQMKNMLGRFAKAKRELGDEVKRQLQELTTCA